MTQGYDFVGAFDCQPYEVLAPSRQTKPFVFNSPHSGRVYPKSFIEQSRLDAHTIRASEDYYVDQLFHCVPDIGAPLLKANFPRAWLDANREPYELDPKMFLGPLPPHVNISSLRVGGGLGTIPKIVAENVDIYQHRLPVQDGLDRIEHVYRPYHDALRQLISRTHANFGYSVLVDCHSMPSNIKMSGRDARADFIIGDRYGSSADARLTQIAMLLLQSMGYKAVNNKPYAGGFITEHYGRPHKKLHAIQIEINRGIYVDEESFERKPHFDRLVTDLQLFSEQFMRYVEHEFDEYQRAAE